ncbi:MAG: hypothetical protein FJ395_01535 [Verrucomicrobia bacterium]|nr:hypothetical protein [Verrucomicrobiota bacterium]
MNDDRLNKLFAAARQAPTDTEQAEFAFETRLLARLREQRRSAAPWFAWSWRLAPLFGAVVIALGVWSFTAPGDPLADIVGDASDEAALLVMLTGE